MLDSLRYVASAVARKDYVPELTHLRVKGGRVTGFNGVIALSTSIDVDLDVNPHASKFVAAVRACPGVISLNVTPSGKLAVKSGKFKSFVDCIENTDHVFVEPEGQEIELGENFMPGLKALAPAMGIDASRPWAMGIKLQNQSMYATNNVMLAEYWHGTQIPLDVVIPAAAVAELLRINQTPNKVQVTERSISFWFGEDRWLRSALVESTGWPTDRIGELMKNATTGNEPAAFPEGFGDALETLKPFVGEAGTIFMTGTHMLTSQHDGEGTSVEVANPVVTEMQAYHHKQLCLLTEIASKVDWTNYPRPCIFTGERLRGVVVGQRV